MYVTSEMIEEISSHFGSPPSVRMTAPVTDEEFDFIKSTQKNGRAHDVTFYIFKDDKLVVNAKHKYPKGLYRAPSGGLMPGEGFITGIKREALEETGAEIELEKFLLIIKVTFTTGKRNLDWTSYIFRARYIAGELKPHDTREIREVALVDLSEFENFKNIIGDLDRGGLSYRARLHEAVRRYL